MGLITVKNLELGYGGSPILKNLNFEVKKGDFICIVGPNGTGKTTLLRGILGLIKPKSGKIQFKNELVKKTIGYMPQETSVDPNFPASILEIVLSGTLNNGQNHYNTQSKEKAKNTLKSLKIEGLNDKSFSELSGGQRQKVLLARALVATEKMLILDEPSNSLDQKSKSELYTLIKKLNKERGITIIMVTHDLDHDNLIGNKILSLRDGDFFFGTTKDFIKKVHHE